MKNIFFYLAYWIIFQFIINILIKNPIRCQYISSSTNSFLLIIYYFFLQNYNQIDNILFFASYYLIDIIYYIVYHFTNLDLLSIKTNENKEKKKKERIVYSIHHILSLILLYLLHNNISDKTVKKYGNIFIVLFEISTLFMNLEFLLKKKLFFKFSFIICRCILLNFFLYKFFFEEKLNISYNHKYITNSILSFLSMYNMFYIITEN